MQWCGTVVHSMAPCIVFYSNSNSILRCAVVAGAWLDVQIYSMGDVCEQCSWVLGMGLAMVCRAAVVQLAPLVITTGQL
jgi:hypothetical protein